MDMFIPTAKSWLRRLAIAKEGCTVLVGSPQWGISRLIEAHSPTLTLHFDFAMHHLSDKTAQASILLQGAQALWGKGHLGEVEGLESVLVNLIHQLRFGPKHQVVITGAEFVPEVVAALSDHQPLVVWYTRLPKSSVLPDNARVIGQDELALTLEEARFIALSASRTGPSLVDPSTSRRGHPLDEDTLQTLHELSGGAFEDFVGLLTAHLKLPSPYTPRLHDFPGPIQAILDRQGWMEALELTAQDFPHQVPQLLQRIQKPLRICAEAGPVLRLLGGLPQQIQRSEEVLNWRLEMALELGQETVLLDEVRAFLEAHEAPRLRACYAEVLERQRLLTPALQQAQRAFEHLHAPGVLYIYGRMLALENPEQGIQHLLDAARLAEEEGDWYWAVLIADSLCGNHTTRGHYRQAVHWGEWGLRLVDQHGLKRKSLRELLLNDWAYARLIAGETLGLEAQLRKAAESVTHPWLSYLLRSTLGDVLLAEGRAEEAYEIYARLWKDQDRRGYVAALSNAMVGILLGMDLKDEAEELAQQAILLTQDFGTVQKRRARLSQAMVWTHRDPLRATVLLEELVGEFSQPLLANRLIQTHLFLAQAYLELGQRERARAVLQSATVEPLLAELGPSGWRYLWCGQMPSELLELMEARVKRLELHFLGEARVVMEGQELRLGERSQELLAALALNPKGLSAEALTLAVYGERLESGTVTVLLSNLKKQLPIQSRPYRLEVEVWADFLEVPKLIQGGRLREGLELVKGRLLAPSEAPAIVEHREYLEEMLRRAVLDSGDLEAILGLAELEGGDLHLWDQVVQLMPSHDPRRAGAQSKQRQLAKDWRG